MALYDKGDKVIEVNTKEKGVITAIGVCGRGGRQLYRVSFKGVEKDVLEGSLMADCNISDPFERCRNNIYGSYKEFLKNNTTFKIKDSNLSTVSSLKASKTLFRAYQYKPLLKFLNSDNKRLLIADEVGLGKTIEAGHIMLEQKARNEFRNALVICPKSLQEKWKTELNDKFGLVFTIVETNDELVRLLHDYDGMVRAIVNYEKIRSIQDEEKNDDKKSKKKTKKSEEKNVLLKYLASNGKKFSFVLCDEAHKMRNANTQTYKGASEIMENADAAVFLTATPIMISERNLYNLLHLLDKRRYSNYFIFLQGLRENAPFLKALNELTTHLALPEIANNLSNAEIVIEHRINERVYRTENHIAKEYFKDFPLFKRIIDRMQNEKDTLALRSQLQYDIMSMSQMNHVFSRTRKREVTTDWSQAERHPYPCVVKLHPNEQKEFNNVINKYIKDNSHEDCGEIQFKQDKILGLIQRKTQIASSVYGHLNDESKLKAGIDEYSNYSDAKVDQLIKVIEEVFKNGRNKIIVFARFKKTLYYLSIRLKKAGYNSVMIHGDVEYRQFVIDDFRDNPNIHIMLSSEVGSEGLDMQFCNSLVNYDLPWNPMVVEQRIGRIDRFGQQSPVVNIYNMIVKGSIQEDIYFRLLERIGIFHESIGDMETILDAEVERKGHKDKISLFKLYSKMEEELYCKDLSREERLRKMDEIARAISNEKENLKRIEEGLTNALTNDAYFRNEINRILNNNAYVTDVEMKCYIDMLLKDHLTTCRLEEVGEEMYEIVIPKSNEKELINFLYAYQPPGVETDSQFSKFINSIRGLQRLKVTFNQEMAYKHRNVVYINMYNPIIQAAIVYFSKEDANKSNTFRFDVRQSDMNIDIHCGSYFLAVYRIETSKMIFGKKRQNYSLYPILYDVENRTIIEDRDFTSAFYGKVQLNGKYQRSDASKDIDQDVITDLQYDLAESIETYRKAYATELELQAENSSKMMMQQTMAYYKSRIDNMTDVVENTEGKLDWARFINDEMNIKILENTLQIQEGNLKHLEEEMENEIQRISQDPQLYVSTNLLSINFIKVI